MRNLLILSSVITTTFLLSACATHSKDNLPKIDSKLAEESWFYQVHLDSAKWIKQADTLNFDPTKLKESTVMRVKVDAFTKIDIKGTIDIQIIGGDKTQSLLIYGSNQNVRDLQAFVKKGTLYIVPKENQKLPMIVRINVPFLDQITNHDKANIVGRDLHSQHLVIDNESSGNITLFGSTDLKSITANGGGNITLIDAYSSDLTITDNNNANINLSGAYNVHTITASGSGDINMIGLQSTVLTINSTGTGNIRLGGYANLQTLNHSGSGDVLLYWVDSPTTRISATGSGVIGLAGVTQSLYANIGDNINMKARYLNNQFADVRAYANAHANVAAHQQLLASSVDNSSIYLFGMTTHLMRYEANNGVVVPLWGNTLDTAPLAIVGASPAPHIPAPPAVPVATAAASATAVTAPAAKPVAPAKTAAPHS